MISGDVFGVLELALAAFAILLDLAAMRVCYLYRHLSRRTYLMMIGLVFLLVGAVIGMASPVVSSFQRLGGLELVYYFIASVGLLRLVGWALFVGGLVGTLADVHRQMRVLVHRYGPDAAPVRTAPTDATVILTHAREENRGTQP